MKRFFLMCGLVIALLLSGCGLLASHVETLKSWSFQYNEGTSDYSLFFGLAAKNDKPLAADVDVDIRIVNDKNEEVYSGTKSVSSDDFGNYTSQAIVPLPPLPQTWPTLLPALRLSSRPPPPCAQRWRLRGCSFGQL